MNMDKVKKWYAVQQQLEAVKAEELKLRNEVFGEAFPAPVEGSKENKLEVGDGWILQGDYKINRSVDEAVAASIEKTDEVLAILNKVLKYKPNLVLPAWKSLTPKELVIVADLVTEKPGTPSLKIVLPKR